jgi:hypothetical protein
MKNYLELAKKIQADPDGNQLLLLEEQNLKEIFRPIYKLDNNISILNSVVAYIILAYTNGSPWLDLNQDRLFNKTKIVKGLDVTIDEFFQTIIDCENKIVNSVVSEYLQDQASWEFQQAAAYLDSHQRLIKFANEIVETGFITEQMNKDGNKVPLTTEYSIEDITVAHEKKAKLLAVAHDNRNKATELIAKLKGDYVQLDNAVQQDFGFSIVDEKRIDPASWRQYIKYEFIPKKKSV